MSERFCNGCGESIDGRTYTLTRDGNRICTACKPKPVRGVKRMGES